MTNSYNTASMRILFVNNVPFNPILGGVVRVTDTLTRALIAKGGFSNYYLCGKVAPQYEYCLKYDFPARQYMLPESGFFSSDKNKEFYRNLLEELKIDIVVNQRGLDSEFDKVLNVGDIKKISVLHTKPNAKIVHDLSRMLLFSNEPKEQIKKYIKILLYPFFYLRTKYKAKRYLRTVYSNLVQNSDAIVLLSDNYKKEFLSNGIDSDNKLICGIPNPNTFPVKKDAQIEKKEKIILFVGRLDPFEKNVLSLIKIWEKLYLIHSDWKLVLVGEGTDRPRIEGYIRNKNIKNVHLEGTKNNVADYYSKASFFCLTSFYEGFPMVLTEGMTYGCIPFTFNNYGAASDIIDDGKNGCLIPAYDLNEYASRLSELIQDKKKRTELANAAVDKVKSFNAENVVLEWCNLFERLIER